MTVVQMNRLINYLFAVNYSSGYYLRILANTIIHISALSIACKSYNWSFQQVIFATIVNSKEVANLFFWITSELDWTMGVLASNLVIYLLHCHRHAITILSIWNSTFYAITAVGNVVLLWFIHIPIPSLINIYIQCTLITK